MKRTLRVIISTLLIIGMALQSVSTASAMVVENEALVLYVGEEFSYFVIGMSEITSITSSNKKVATAEISKDSAKSYTITAKKAGKVKITVKGTAIGGKSHTESINIEVKKLDLKTKYVKQTDTKNVIISIKNNTKQVFEYVSFEYSLKDSNGKVLREGTDYIKPSLPSTTGYFSVYANGKVDFSKSKFKITSVVRYIGYEYTAVTSKKLKATAVNQKKTDTKVTYTIRQENKTNESVSGTLYIIIYDKNNKMLDIDDTYINLEAKAKKDSSEQSIFLSKYPDYDHFKLVPQAYYKKKLD